MVNSPWLPKCLILVMRLLLLLLIGFPPQLMAQSNDNVWVSFSVSDYHRSSYSIPGIQITIDDSITKTIGVDGNLSVLLSIGNHRIEINAMSYYPRSTTITIKESGDYNFYMVSNGLPPDDIVWEETVLPKPNKARRRKRSK